MSHLPLTKIGFYNPRRLTDQEIEASFIARNALFQFIFEKISSHSQALIPQHLIIIGQRGMGKTLLLYRLGVELKKAPHHKKFIPLNYPEEQYNIDRLSKFWLNSLNALIEALDTANKTDLANQLENELEQLSTETLSNASDMYQLFQNWITKIDRCPVLLVDNLNLIFNNISTEDQHKLRANLMTKGAPILIGASAVTIQDTIEYGAPFYDAFLIRPLRKISLEDSIEILKNLHRLTGKLKENEIAKKFTTYKGRIATLHQLTGGTPRTLSMLFPLISDGFSDDIQNDLHALMDMTTPLYKARFEELSTQMQIVLDAIALHWHPASIEHLRRITQLSNAQLSPQLKRLVDVGWLNKLKSNSSKGVLYEISERFFNVWYLMRRSNRRQEMELHCLSKFLEMFYGEDINQIAISRLKIENTSEEGIFIDLAIANVIKDEKLSTQLSEKSYKKLIEEAKKNPEIFSKYSISNEKVKSEIIKLLNKLLISYRKNKIDDAIQLSKELTHLTKKYNNHKLLSITIVDLLLTFSKKLRGLKLYGESEELLNEILKLCNLQSINRSQKHLSKLWFEFGNVYAITKRFNKAIEAFLKVESSEMKDSYYWSCLGASYQDTQNFESAREAYLKSIKLNPSRYVVYQLLGDMCFYKLLNYETAEKAYLGALDLKPKQIEMWLNLVLLYKKIKKPVKAEYACNCVLKMDKKNSLASLGLAYLYLIDLHQSEKSIKAHLSFIENTTDEVNANDSNILMSRYNLFFLHINCLNNFDAAKEQLSLIPKNHKLKREFTSIDFICKAILSYYEQNAGIAKGHIKNAKSEFNNKTIKFYNWTMAGIIIKNLNYGEHYVEVLKEVGFDKIWKPYYVAMKALLSKEPNLYLNTIAQEVRQPASEILDWMLKFEAAKMKK